MWQFVVYAVTCALIQVSSTDYVCKTNEVYDLCPATCPYRTCGIDDRLVDCPQSLPRPGDPDCPEPACRCKDQTFRDDKGNCVPWEKCPKCNKPNEVYDPCDAPCPSRRCDFNATAVRCGRPPQVGDPSCIVGCRCIDGYRRDSRGSCIPADKCPKAKCNKPNEVYDPCDAPCPARRCDFNAAVVRCGRPPKVGDPSCLVGCRCIDGYLRDSRGNCIPANKCPKCTNPNEVYDPCDAPCPARRCDFNGALVKCAAPPKVGDPSCLVGCRCKNGYLRDGNGVCIEAKKCPKCTKPNQVYYQCPDCSPQTCKTKDKKYHCPLIPANKCGPNCHPACRCKPGYYKNLIGECIRASDCDKCPGDHEYFSCGVACDNVCATLSKQNQTNCPIINKKCTEMCYCEEGYARAPNNTCIPIKDCKPKCTKKNEVYDPCPDCSPQTCETKNRIYDCYLLPPNVPKPDCQPACRCKPGYYRNLIGECILASDCDKCPAEHEYFSCGGACDNVCATLSKQNQTNCPIKNIKCNEMCYCEKGYARAANNTCIPIKDCKPKCTKYNEVYDKCPDCSPQTCETRDRIYDCNLLPPNATKPDCQPACRCKPGYYRNLIGDCISASDCAKCPNPNEVYAVVKCSPPPDSRCIFECRCIYGYVRDSKGVCIPAVKCPKCTKANEVCDPCPDCSPQTCETKDRIYDCNLLPPNVPKPDCKPACRCKPGYYRNLIGECILASDCDKCPAEHEYFSCGGACDNVCATLSKQNQTNCPIINIKCNEMCYCEKGYARAANNTCIPIKDCNPKCPNPNEVYAVVKCAPPPDSTCIFECRCIHGYVRDSKGVCVPAVKCPKCTKANEVCDPCPDCSPQTCETKDRIYDCNLLPPNVPKPDCKPACRCKPGYYRNLIGECILASDCDKCPAEHEFFSCGGACDNVCATLSKQNQTNCPIVNIKCNEMCYCENGYARATNNTCIPIKDCKGDCKENEVYSSCPAGLCAPLTCAQAGYPIQCADYPQCPGEPGCICKSGYLRNSQGICIPSDQCPSCGGDVNAKPGCGSNCGKRCSDIGKKVTACPLFCLLNGCDCKDNYYYDSNRKKCVPACDCTPTCAAGEQFSNCANGLCSPQDCKDKGKRFPCAPMLPGSCVPGCICQTNYLRKNGTCIPEDQCEPTPVCRDDEELSTCANALCRAQECKEKGQPIACPSLTQCLKGCVCPQGTLRSANGLCIPENQCPVTFTQCKQYEIFSECANGICRAQDCKDKGVTVPCPPMVQDACTPGCVCQVQHLRKNGVCVPQAQCGDKPVCKINEVYSDCSNGLCRVQDCKDKGLFRPCPPMAPGSCLPGCICPEQYLRQNGTCVPEDQCEPPPPTNPPDSNTPQPASPPVYIPTQPASPPVSNSPQPANPPDSNTPQPARPPVYIPIQPASPPVSNTPQPANPPVSNTPQPAHPPVSNTPQPANPPVSNTPQPTSPPVSNTPQPTSPSVCNQNQNSCGDVDSLQRSLAQASNTLGLKTLYQLAVATPGVSTIISPFSYFVLLAQLALYSNGQTYTELINVLNVTTKDDIRCAFPGLANSIEGTQGAEIDIGNKIYVNDQYQLSDQYKKDSVVVFNAEAENINFNNPTQAANTINDWVSDETKGKITELVSADMFNSMTRLVLANAIYFKGIWKTEFNPNLTESADFYVDSQKTIKVQMMQQKGKFNYAHSPDIDSQLVEIPYKNENMSLVLVSPNQQDGLRNVLDRMRDPAMEIKVLCEMRQETVTIFMPKFDILSNINIKDILEQIGVQTIFGSNAELSGMVVPDEALYVSDALQKATITVNEQGSEAAAASVAVVATRSLPRPPREFIIRADRPFLYGIRFNNIFLFGGFFYG